MKYRKAIFICAVLAVLAAASALGINLCNEKTYAKAEATGNEVKVFSNVLFIGDSLTDGGYWYYDENREKTVTVTEKNYPSIFCRINGINGRNEGYCGIGAQEWYLEKSLEDYSAYDMVIIWLGTNDGYKPEQFEHGVRPYSDPEKFENTPTAYYCRIIEDIKADNPAAYIVLCTIYVGGNSNDGSTTDTTNETIRMIGEHYGCQVCDLSWLALTEDTEYHAEIDNIHLGIYGNLRLAEFLTGEISAAIAGDYTIAERNFAPTPDYDTIEREF